MNTAQILGRLTRDPELRSLPDGTAVCDLRVAVDGMGRTRDKAGYIDVTVFGSNAEAQAEYLSKGREIAVAGDLRFEEYEAKDGGKRSRHYIVARTVDWTARGQSRDASEADKDAENGEPEPANA